MSPIHLKASIAELQLGTNAQDVTNLVTTTGDARVKQLTLKHK